MPARKVKNDNKELESIEEMKKDTVEQINIEEEPDESKRPK